MYKIKLVIFLLFLSSCYFGNSFSTNNVSLFNLPSVGDDFAPSDSEYFYIDLDQELYESSQQIIPYYDINTTEEYGDSQNRESPSNCEIFFEENADEDDITQPYSETLICILDILEFDIVAKDIHITFNFPEGMCSYVETGLPWHFNHAIREGPEVEEDPCGDDATAGCETQYFDRNNPSNTESTEEDLCPGDPKCCSGGRRVNGEEWEPELECFGGPALIAQGESVPDDREENFYKPVIQEPPEGGIKQSFTLPRLISINGTSAHSLTHSNYLRALDSSFEDLQSLSRNTLPIFLRNSIYPESPRLFFEFDCIDSAGEILHSIKLLLREWNTFEEFIDFYGSGGNDQADPDVTGLEGVDCDYEERTILSGEGGGECNDSFDFDDFSSYPQVEYSEAEDEAEAE